MRCVQFCNIEVSRYGYKRKLYFVPNTKHAKAYIFPLSHASTMYKQNF